MMNVTTGVTLLTVKLGHQSTWSCGAMDSAPDFESGGWGFESLRDRFLDTVTSAIGLVVKYLVANEVPRVRFPDGAFAFVAQLAARGSHNPKVAGSTPVESIFARGW